MLHCENSYFIPNLEVTGYLCKTNMPTNTAFRGFGGPQGMLNAENYVRDVANKLGKTSEEVARLNLYQEGQTTHFHQVLSHCTLVKCWDECIIKSDYAQRKKHVEEYNRYTIFF